MDPENQELKETDQERIKIQETNEIRNIFMIFIKNTKKINQEPRQELVSKEDTQVRTKTRVEH